MPERETKLVAPPGFRLPELGGDGLRAQVMPARRYTTVYWDTADLRLAQWGASLRHRDDEGWTVKLPPAPETAGPAAGPMVSRDEIEFQGIPSALPDEAAALVAAFTRGQPVAPVARLVAERHPVLLTGEDGARLAEVADDDVRIVEGGLDVGRFRELEVELLGDADDDTMDQVLARLTAAGAIVPERRLPGKYTRALGRRMPSRPELHVKPPKKQKASVARVLRSALADGAGQLLRSLPAARLGETPAAAGQALDAVRRLRATLKLFAPVLDEGWVKELRGELGWLKGRLGEVRDAETMLARLADATAGLPEPDAANARRLAPFYATRREAARERLLDALDDQRATILLDAVVAAVQAPAVTREARRRAAKVLPGLAGAQWRALRKQVQEAGDDLDDLDDAVMAQIGAKARAARFAAEATRPVLGKRVGRLAEAAAAVEQGSDALRDAVLAESWLREAARPVTAPVALAAGQLIAAERLAAAAARAEWALTPG